MKTLRSGTLQDRNTAQFPPPWTTSDVHQWREGKGTLTEVIRGNRVDLYVRLESIASRFFRVLVFASGIAFCLVFWQILFAFLSGRVHMVVSAIEAGMR